MMVTIRDRQISGIMECAVDNGGVFSVMFHGGKPITSRDRIAQVLNRDSVVVAWMPHSDAEISARRNAGAGDSEDDRLRRRLQEAMAGHAVFADKSGWFSVVRKTEIFALSLGQEDFSGGGILTGLVAQVNGAFADVLRNKPLVRFTLDCGGARLGYEALGGEWTTLYKVPADRQGDAVACTRQIRKILGERTGGELYAVQSRLTDRLKSTYAMFRPQWYRQLERSLRRELKEADTAWSHIWFKFSANFVYSMSLEGEANQEVDGSLEQLLRLIRQAFEPLGLGIACNLVLHSTGTTIWTDFFPEGFWATRFDGDTVTLRSTAGRIASLGEQRLRSALGDPVRH